MIQNRNIHKSETKSQAKKKVQTNEQHGKRIVKARQAKMKFAFFFGKLMAQ